MRREGEGGQERSQDQEGSEPKTGVAKMAELSRTREVGGAGGPGSGLEFRVGYASQEDPVAGRD